MYVCIHSKRCTGMHICSACICMCTCIYVTYMYVHMYVCMHILHVMQRHESLLFQVHAKATCYFCRYMYVHMYVCMYSYTKTTCDLCTYTSICNRCIHTYMCHILVRAHACICGAYTCIRGVYILDACIHIMHEIYSYT